MSRTATGRTTMWYQRKQNMISQPVILTLFTLIITWHLQSLPGCLAHFYPSDVTDTHSHWLPLCTWSAACLIQLWLSRSNGQSLVGSMGNVLSLPKKLKMEHSQNLIVVCGVSWSDNLNFRQLWHLNFRQLWPNVPHFINTVLPLFTYVYSRALKF